MLNLKFFYFRFISFIEKADCKKTMKSRGVLFEECENIKYINISNIESPKFFAYKCDHENNVQYKTKYFANSDDPSYIYVTYIPVGCYNKKLIVPKVSYSYAYQYFSDEDNIPVISNELEIDGKKIIRFAK